MREFSPFNFGHLIAYLIPGFVVLWGAGEYVPTVRAWLAAAPDTAPTVGGLFFATMASLACGMIAGAFRWAIVDSIHHRTGVRLPRWDFSLLQGRLEAYELMVEFHYRYYQFFANMLIAILLSYPLTRISGAVAAVIGPLADVGFVVVSIVLFLASRDALQKYYRRAGQVLASKRKLAGQSLGREAARSTPPQM